MGESRAGVRALIVARKRRNGRGAKGGRKVDAKKAIATERDRVPVSEMTKPPGEIHMKEKWAEPTVWKNRMLTAPVEGVKGGMDRMPSLRRTGCSL